MAIRGQTKSILTPPLADKEVDPFESFLPRRTDLRNGFITDAGQWHKRPGYNEGTYDLGVDKGIHSLVPELSGYAITSVGAVFQLDGISTATELVGPKLGGGFRPSFANHQGDILLFDGGDPIKIADGETSLVGGSPPKGRWVDTIDTYAVIAGGYSKSQFNWSALGNSGSWPIANFNSVTGDGEEIKFFKVFKRTIFFFKTKSIETWINAGGTSVFSRQSYIERGCGASDSVVQANDTFYWFGDDGDFYVLNGLQPQVISKSYRRELDKIPKENQSFIYGFDYRKEHLIRWFAPIEGKCFTFDYTTNTFSEDNTWEHGQFERLPHNSYMELDGKQFFGDYNLTGKIYQWDKSFKDDNGLPIRVLQKFSVKLSVDGNQSRINRLKLRVKRGENNAKMSVRWRFDRGEYHSPVDLDLGAPGDRDPYIDIYNLGIGREAELEIVETDAVDFLLTDALLTVERLGS